MEKDERYHDSASHSLQAINGVVIGLSEMQKGN